MAAADHRGNDRPLIFMNYRSGDDPSAATLLYRELDARLGTGAVFMDYESVPLGHDFEPVLLRSVRRCSVLLVVIGRDWLSLDRDGRRLIDDPDDWVRREILEALAGEALVVPVLVGGASKLQEADLPPDLEVLARLQYARIHRRQQLRDIQGLIDTLVAQVLEIGDTVPQEPAATTHIVFNNVQGPYVGDRGLQINDFSSPRLPDLDQNADPSPSHRSRLRDGGPWARFFHGVRLRWEWLRPSR